MANILVVEDNQLAAQDAAEALRAAGHAIIGIAKSGEQALVLAERTHPDLALVDIGLPGPLDGIVVAERLNALDIAIVYLSAHSEPQVLDRAAHTQPYAYLLKPVTDQALSACVQVALTRHRLERLRREHELWFSALMHCMEIAVLVTDEYGSVEFANGHVASLLGRAAWTDTNVTQLFEFPASAPNPIDEAMSQGKPRHLPAGSALVRSAGVRVLIEGCVAPIGEAGAPSLGAAFAFRERREPKSHTPSTALGSLAAEIAHDVNNMLTLIVTCADLGQSESARHASTRELFTDIQVCAGRAGALLDELMGHRMRAETSIAEAFERLIRRDVEIALRGSPIEFEYQVDPNLWPGEIGDVELADVLTNLVVNARHAMRDEGQLRIRASNRIVAPNEEIDLAAGRYVEIAVSDSGGGMEPATLKRAFEPYFTTKASGSGLGLPSARRIAERCGGRLLAESTVGEGSTFFLTLPARESPRPRPKTIAASPRSTRVGRVLILDDDQKIREVLAKLIRYLGWEAEAVGSGEDAIARYAEALSAGQRFDLLILDLQLKEGIGGAETFERLKAIDPDVRAVVSSGYPQHVLADYEALGFSASLAKPYDVEKLAAILERYGPEPREPD